MDDEEELYEMVGTLVEWDGIKGWMVTDDGERIFMSRARDLARGAKFPYAVGCRIHCLVSAEVTYKVKHVRLVEPAPASRTEPL